MHHRSCPLGAEPWAGWSLPSPQSIAGAISPRQDIVRISTPTTNPADFRLAREPSHDHPATTRRLHRSERLSRAWSDAIRHESDKNHSHALLIVSKSSIATPDAVAHLARALGLQPGRLAFAGLKDKHAQTTQHITVAPDGRGSPPRIPDRLSAPNWEARPLGWVAEPLTADGIDGNAFELVVRDLSRAASDEMARRADILRVAADDGPALLIVNYFGSQRFGGARHHQGWIGRALIEGDFESALRLAVGTPARKDTGRVRSFTRMAAARWGSAGLARDLPVPGCGPS